MNAVPKPDYAYEVVTTKHGEERPTDGFYGREELEHPGHMRDMFDRIEAGEIDPAFTIRRAVNPGSLADYLVTTAILVEDISAVLNEADVLEAVASDSLIAGSEVQRAWDRARVAASDLYATLATTVPLKSEDMRLKLQRAAAK
jgi:hypothetical protein